MSYLPFAKTVLKNLFSKPATVDYPAAPAKAYERTRGRVDILIDDCIFCGICQKKCPTGAITVSRQDKTWEIIRFDCIQCGYCTEGCPKKCLSMAGEYTKPAEEKSKEVFHGA